MDRRLRTLELLVLVCAGSCCYSVAGARAASIAIANPSFETDMFSTYPGYVGGNAPITGWVSIGATGINPGGGNPFADNGQVPDGTQVAFIQGVGSLAQDISGLDTSKQYWLQYYTNARASTAAPAGSVTYAGVTLASKPVIVPVGGTNPYYFVNVPFVPSAASGALTFTGDAVAGDPDRTVLIDAVSIIQRDPGQIVIQNPSFEATGLVAGGAGVGYSNNIAGWNASGGTGIDPSTGGANFTDNGAIPDGSKAAFLQGTSSLSQPIGGLVVGQRYRLTFSYDARNCCGDIPSITVSIGGGSFTDPSISPVGGTNAYHSGFVEFTASAPSMTLSIASAPNAGGDASALIDNLSLSPVPEPSSGVLLSVGLGCALVWSLWRRIVGRRTAMLSWVR